MIDTPLLLIALGMSAASGLALALSRRKRRQIALPNPDAVAHMTTAELTHMLHTLQPSVPEYELVRSRLTVLVIEEIERRQLPQPDRY